MQSSYFCFYLYISVSIFIFLFLSSNFCFYLSIFLFLFPYVPNYLCLALYFSLLLHLFMFLFLFTLLYVPNYLCNLSIYATKCLPILGEINFILIFWILITVSYPLSIDFYCIYSSVSFIHLLFLFFFICSLPLLEETFFQQFRSSSQQNNIFLDKLNL